MPNEGIPYCHRPLAQSKCLKQSIYIYNTNRRSSDLTDSSNPRAGWWVLLSYTVIFNPFARDVPATLTNPDPGQTVRMG